MTIPRMVWLLICFAVVGIAVVAIRVDQSRSVWQIQQMQFEQTRLQREICSQKMELARLRSPGMVRERAVRPGLAVGGVVPSGEASERR